MSHSVFSQASFARALRLFALLSLALWQVGTAMAQADITFEKASYRGDAFANNSYRMAAFAAKTTATGGLTGTLKVPGRSFAFRGEFSATGSFEQTFPTIKTFPGG